MPDTFAITVIFIVVATGVAALVRRIRRDKCLKDFQGHIVTLEEISGNTDQGRLHVENTGLALRYAQEHRPEGGPVRTGSLLYKAEYSRLYALVRYHDDLDEEHRRARRRDLERTYHPNLWRRWRRKALNVFKTIRDSISEVVTLLLAQVKKSPGAGRMLAGQDRYVTQMQQEALGVAGTSYEPLLEPCIGHQVLVAVSAHDPPLELRGILKEYTADFLEIMDMDYTPDATQPRRKADLVMPRSHAIVRFYAE